MAVVRTGDIFNYLTFGGVDSRDYGIYITGKTVFNAPARAVEAVSVPGRNGDILIDQGHWNNIPVEYTAGYFDDDMSKFAENLSAFRNAIVSQKGYQRLTDTYNPDEYRMGVFMDGLAVDTAGHKEAGEFNLVFNSKPQRFLTEGETAVSVASGDTLTNPTLYDASPLIYVPNGYGSLKFNDAEIIIANETVGNVQIADLKREAFFVESWDVQEELSTSLGSGMCLPGDDLTITDGLLSGNLYFATGYEHNVTDISLQSETGSGRSTFSKSGISLPYKCWITPPDNAEYGTDFETTYRAVYRITMVDGSVTGYANVDFKLTLRYSAQDNLLTLIGEIDTGYIHLETSVVFVEVGPVVANSSIPISGSITIDTEIGHVFKTIDGETKDFNSYVNLGSDLPKLAPGENEITFDSTMTGVQITPRWWQL